MKKNRYFVKSIVVLGLITSVAFASDNDIEANDNGKKDVEIKSSIQISGNSNEEFENKSAKISAEDVVKVVKDKFTGKILSVKLENENKNLVYTAEVFKNNQITDVVVDAGDGKILSSTVDKKDSNDGEEGDEHEENNDEK